MSTICSNCSNSEGVNPSPHWIKSSKELIYSWQVVEDGLLANANAASSYCAKSASCPRQATELLSSSLLQATISTVKKGKVVFS